MSDLPPRLMGLETEYAVTHVGADQPPTSAREVYDRIVSAIGHVQPMLPGVFDDDQWFLANGASLTLETHPLRWHMPGALVELATPEVNRVDQLLVADAACDRLIRDAVAEVSSSTTNLRVLKNSSDSLGHLYGCQENYECEVARGIVRPLFLIAMLGVILIEMCTRMVTIPVLMVVTGWTLFRQRFGGSSQSRSDAADDLESNGSGNEASENDRSDPWELSPPSRWLAMIFRPLHLPAVWALRSVCRRLVFRDVQRYLTTHLITRVIVCGGGYLDHQNHFHLSAKGMAVDRITDMGGFSGERPIYVFGHWLTQLSAKSFFSVQESFRLLSRRNRLQIGFSDSNLSATATAMKVGSVAVLLDMIDAGHGNRLPRLKKPLEALRELNRDWNLISRYACEDGERTALDIQKRTFDAAAQFVREQPPEYARRHELTLRVWSECLQALSAFRRDADRTEDAIGRIDWLTKRVIMDRTSEKTQWPVRKKVDLRYHELSGEGYHHQIVSSHDLLRLVTAADVDKATRWPPEGSPAMRRGHWIREHACAPETNTDNTAETIAADSLDATVEWTFGKQGDRVVPFRFDDPAT